MIKKLLSKTIFGRILSIFWDFLVWWLGNWTRVCITLAGVFAALFWISQKAKTEYKELAEMYQSQIEGVQKIVLEQRDLLKLSNGAIVKLKGDSSLLSTEKQGLIDSLLTEQTNKDFWKGRIEGMQGVLLEMRNNNIKFKDENAKLVDENLKLRDEIERLRKRRR